MLKTSSIPDVRMLRRVQPSAFKGSGFVRARVAKCRATGHLGAFLIFGNWGEKYLVETSRPLGAKFAEYCHVEFILSTLGLSWILRLGHFKPGLPHLSHVMLQPSKAELEMPGQLAYALHFLPMPSLSKQTSQNQKEILQKGILQI